LATQAVRQFIKQGNNPYFVERPGGEVYRLHRDGSHSRIADKAELDKILSNHRVISEAEALILVYSGGTRRKPREPRMPDKSRRNQRRAAGFGRARSTDSHLKSVHAIIAVAVIFIFMLLVVSMMRTNLGSFVEFVLLMLALPAIAFGLGFLLVAGTAITGMIYWLILKLRERE
jgi:hypothetical protein